jgi:uncharacterized phage-associated protein
MAYDARAVANHFLDLAERDGVPLTPMQILKLVYIAHGWTLAITGRPLVEDEIEAWRFGPVIPSVYNAFRRFGSGQIKEKAVDLNIDKLRFEEIEAGFSQEEKEILDRVWKTYGRLTAYQLSGLTHRENTPWTKVWTQKGGSQHSDSIPNDLIQEHFIDLARQNARRQRQRLDQ